MATRNRSLAPSRNRRAHYPWLLGAESLDPPRNRRALISMATRSRVTSTDAARRKSELLALPTQGLFFTTLADQSAVIWADAIMSLSSECLKFVLNAAYDTLPNNSNLHLWKKKKYLFPTMRFSTINSHPCPK